jgi:hypothetical protein
VDKFKSRKNILRGNMTLYKVALRADARPLSTHIYSHTARAAKREAGFEYNVYKWESDERVWKKL